MRINTNIMALNAWRNLQATSSAMSKNLERLSSGYRINKAADDAAGLAIAEKMKAQVIGLRMAQRNAQDGISLIQTAEGGLSEIESILQRMRELVLQASNSPVSQPDRANIQAEIDELIKEIDRIANTTRFNETPLLNGTLSDSKIQIGIGGTSDGTYGQLSITISNMTATGLSVNDVKVYDSTNPTNPINFDSLFGKLDQAIQDVTKQRATLGALQNRLEHTINNLMVAAENTEAARSRIVDTDVALEMASFTKNQILVQAGVAMLAQANMSPQAVLKLLG